MFEAALDAGASNCESDTDGHMITTSKEDFASAAKALEEKFGEPMSAKLTWVAGTLTEINESQAESLLKFIDVLEDNDDVQQVCTNFEVDEEILGRLYG